MSRITTNTAAIQNTAAGGSSQPAVTAQPAGSGAPRKPRRLLCLKEVKYRTSISRAGIYRLLAEVRDTRVPVFPLPVQVTKGRIGWHEHEIEAWIESRPRVSAVDVEAALKSE
jgi:predicted DNA-binding transcriptional regulator AlpA